MLFHNPDTGENRAHDGCIHEVARRTMGYMARIFDVPAYFRMQSRCESPVSRPFVLALQVDDNFIEGNNGTFLLNISRKHSRRWLSMLSPTSPFPPISPPSLPW